MDEILSQLMREIESSGYSSSIRAGIVITGGGSKLQGLDNYTESKYNIPVRIGSPKPIPGITNLNGLTRFSTAVGLLLYRDEQLKKMPHRKLPKNSFFAYLSKTWNKISSYFHREL
tara:strand:+ start:10 stop:357 length:348 start_codon:yes stop_codon:yes gene_type:complete